MCISKEKIGQNLNEDDRKDGKERKKECKRGRDNRQRSSMRNGVLK